MKRSEVYVCNVCDSKMSKQYGTKIYIYEKFKCYECNVCAINDTIQNMYMRNVNAWVSELELSTYIQKLSVYNVCQY